MRKSIDGLAALVQQQFKLVPYFGNKVGRQFSNTAPKEIKMWLILVINRGIPHRHRMRSHPQRWTYRQEFRHLPYYHCCWKLRDWCPNFFYSLGIRLRNDEPESLESLLSLAGAPLLCKIAKWKMGYEVILLSGKIQIFRAKYQNRIDILLKNNVVVVVLWNSFSESGYNILLTLVRLTDIL